MAENAVSELRETVSRFSGIQDQNAYARACQLKSGRQACKAASNNDYVATHANPNFASITVPFGDRVNCNLGDQDLSEVAKSHYLQRARISIPELRKPTFEGFGISVFIY